MSDSSLLPTTNDSTNGGRYVVIARRYRPQTFDELVGQEHVARALQQAISILLETPVVSDPIQVVESGAASWEYADLKLESLDATQKQLLRMGPKHTEALLTWLRAFNASLRAR